MSKPSPLPRVPESKAYEALVLDGGWLTVAALAMESGMREDSVATTMTRLARKGWVEKRERDRNRQTAFPTPEYRAIENHPSHYQ